MKKQKKNKNIYIQCLIKEGKKYIKNGYDYKDYCRCVYDFINESREDKTKTLKDQLDPQMLELIDYLEGEIEE